MKDIIAKIKNAGIVGAGGAGFPTHVKLSCKAEYLIANGAECEPLLRVDRQTMTFYAQEVVQGVRLAKQAVGAKQAIICLKAHYTEAKESLERAIGDSADVDIHQMKSYYPAGDEQSMVFETTGRVVPTGGIPLDVGAVVCNVGTLLNIARAQKGEAVTHKFVTVGGEVPVPCTLNVPIGTPIKELLKQTGFKMTEEYTLIIGGPCMGNVCEDENTPVTKTTGGVLVFKKTHPLIIKKARTTSLDLRLIKSVCCQCSMCTQLCPRNVLGLKVEPHRAMRSVANENGKLLGDVNGVFSCCECGICTYYACNFGLKPSQVMGEMKRSLINMGIKPDKTVYTEPDDGIATKKVPLSRLINRLGIEQYDIAAPLKPEVLAVKMVKLPLKMHIGAPCVPVVKKGDMVSVGQLLAEIPENAMGANIHASISGVVTRVTKDHITLSVRGGLI